MKPDLKNIPIEKPKTLKRSLTASLPAYLKDPANYDKIQRALLETLAGRHSHEDVLKWHACLYCQQRVQQHKLTMRKLGFQSYAQYLQWKRIMDIMINKKRMPIR